VQPSLGASLSARAAGLAGWEFEGGQPAVRRYVCLAVPHTSNWDALLLLLLARGIGLPMAWMIKDSWIRGPLGPALLSLGAVAVDRSRKNDLVQQMIEEFGKRDELVLGIPPEGTRKRAEHWKSGFYAIARGAGVPVVPGYLDYATKRAGLGPPIELTGDVRADMDRVRAFYRERAPRARRPDWFGPIRLRSEEARGE